MSETISMTETETLTYRDAIIRGLADAMAEDESVFFFGEDVAAAGGPFKLSEGLLDRFGPKRVLDTPISEQAIIGTAIGASLAGLRPVAEIMFADFAAVCYDGIANELAKYRYMTGGQVSVPATIRLGNGASGFAAQHSQSCENWFLNVAGLKIVVPATAADAYGLLRAAIRDPDPVLVFEHKHLFNSKEEVVGGLKVAEIGKAEIVRSGTDVTVVGSQRMRHHAVAAAELLAGEGISVEVIDPRTIVPFDLDTVGESIDRTNHLVVAQECTHDGSWGASMVARLMVDRFESLDAPPLIVGGDETPVPYSGPLEDLWVPSAERIADGIRRTLAY